MKLYTFRSVPLSIMRSSFTLHSEMACHTYLYVIHTRMTYAISECTVNELLMMDRRNYPKHVEFHAKVICEIGASGWFYYKEICYDARSHESKIS
jgi:hypothetical protein